MYEAMIKKWSIISDAEMLEIDGKDIGHQAMSKGII